MAKISAMVGKSAFLLCCVSLATACGARSRSFNAEARIVVGTPGQFCSIFVDDPTPPASKDAGFGQLMSYVDQVRSNSMEVMVTYIDLRTAAGLTLTTAKACPASDDTLTKGKEQAAAMGLRASATFTPTVRTLQSTSGAPPRLTDAVQHLNGPRASLAACTMAIRLSPSASAEADARFNLTLAKARDNYGLPLLFSAQKDSILYISLYRQCADLNSAFLLFKSISSTDPAHGVTMLGHERADENDLKEIYGPLF